MTTVRTMDSGSRRKPFFGFLGVGSSCCGGADPGGCWGGGVGAE